MIKHNLDSDISSKIKNSKEWYENNLFHHLKDKKNKRFNLIYIGIIEKPEEYESLEDIRSRTNLEDKEIIMDGSVTIIKSNKIFARWIVTKAD